MSDGESRFERLSYANDPLMDTYTGPSASREYHHQQTENMTLIERHVATRRDIWKAGRK